MPEREHLLPVTDDAPVYLLIRRYRRGEHVLGMYFDRNQADASFEEYRRELRDGDLILAQAALTKLRVESGGYNRTRW